MEWNGKTMTSIKVCGITRVEDGLAASRAGCNGVGFIFAPSPRRVAPADARAIARRLPPLVARVGVFVDAPVEEMAAVAKEVGLDVIQLHGSEPPSVADAVREATGCRIVKALRLKEPRQLERLQDYPADGWLLDTYRPGQAGGTGQVFPWRWLQEVPPPPDVVVFIAGGLTPDNVAEALRQGRPHGVDVSSGVEAAPGIKDHGLIRRFIREVRRFDLGDGEDAA